METKKTKFEELFTAKAEELELKKLPGKIRSAKRSLDSFIDNLQYDALEELNAKEDRALMAFVRGDKDALTTLIEARQEKQWLEEAKVIAEELKKELF